jgi:hypothetical protein
MSDYAKREIRKSLFAKARQFAEQGDPRAAGACLWCGCKLRINGRRTKFLEVPTAGDYADGAFCTMRCGYAFGVASAISGTRFAVRAHELARSAQSDGGKA